MKKSIINLLLVIFFLTNNNILAQNQKPQINLEEGDYILRKMSISKIFDGLATAIFNVAKITNAKTKKEKDEAALNIIGSVVQIAADAVKKHKKPQSNQSEENKQNQVESNNKNNSSDENTVNTDKTKSLKTDHLEQIQLLSCDEEKRIYINEMLQSKDKTEEFLDELNYTLKNILFDNLFD